MWRLHSPICGLLECGVYHSLNGYTILITFGDEILCANEVESLEEAHQHARDWRRTLLPVTESCE